MHLQMMKWAKLNKKNQFFTSLFVVRWGSSINDGGNDYLCLRKRFRDLKEGWKTMSYVMTKAIDSYLPWNARILNRTPVAAARDANWESRLLKFSPWNWISQGGSALISWKYFRSRNSRIRKIQLLYQTLVNNVWYLTT